MVMIPDGDKKGTIGTSFLFGPFFVTVEIIFHRKPA